MEITSHPQALYKFARNAPMIVLRKWPTWNDFAIFGDEYSMITRLPCPDEFVPYSGRPDDVLCVSACTWLSVSLMRVEELRVKWRNVLSWTTVSIHASGWN